MSHCDYGYTPILLQFNDNFKAFPKRNRQKCITRHDTNMLVPQGIVRHEIESIRKMRELSSTTPPPNLSRSTRKKYGINASQKPLPYLLTKTKAPSYPKTQGGSFKARSSYSYRTCFRNCWRRGCLGASKISAGVPTSRI